MLRRNIIQDHFTLFTQGKEEGFTHFFTLHFAPLNWFAQKILDNKEVAEDVVEDSFVKLWERKELLKNEAAIRAFLYTTVRNACLDFLRREKRRLGYLKEAMAIGDKEEPAIIHKIIEAETLFLVYTAMESLPPKCGKVFRMFYLEQKSLNEIALELGIATTTVISQKKRALELLRKKLPYIGILLAFITPGCICILHPAAEVL